MRRLLAAAVLAALLATAAACGGDSDSGSGSGAAATSGSNSTAQAQPNEANTKQVCSDAQKVVTDSTKKFTSELTKTLTAAATGDKSVTDTAVQTVKDLFLVWANGIRAQAEKALDPELKTALATMADELTKVEAKVKTFADLENADKLLSSAELNAADRKVAELCGSF